jgi:serine/threonine protein kinase
MNTGSSTTASTDMRSFQGQVIDGRYQINEFIAEGHFGAVFRGEQMFLGCPTRQVAVKLSKHTGIKPEQAREIFADIFVLAQAMDEMRDSDARHHLVHVYDAGLTPALDHRAYIVMEYVPGATLEEQFRSYKKVSAPQLLAWASQIAKGVGGLHRLPSPLVHRDLKPDNVLLGVDNTVRIVDFGLTARLNAMGKVPGVAGTLKYMAPETHMGQSEPASDVYSIGLMLYEGLTGVLPFDHLIPPLELPVSCHAQWLHEHKQRIHITPPSALNNTVSRELDSLILRCLKFSPSERWRNGGDLFKGIDALLHPSSLLPDAAALEEARRLRAANQLPEALAAFERGLSAPQPQAEVRVELLNESSELLEHLKRFNEAADKLTRLWSMIEHSGSLLPQSEERAALLDRLASLLHQAGRSFQAQQITDKRRTLFSMVPRSMGDPAR